MKRKGILGGIFAMVLILALALVLGAGSVSAVEPYPIGGGACGANGDNVTYTLDSTGLLTISGTGKMADYESKTDSASGEEITTAPWGSQAKMVKTVVIEDGVTGIGNYAFYCCTDLTGVNMGGTVTSIGADAFAACIGLTSVTIPDSVTDIEGEAFAQCMGLTSVAIPDSVKNIGIGAFHYCTSLTSVTIGSGVTDIGNLAFWQCTALTDVTLGSSVTVIGEQAFNSCEKLTDIVIPDSVTTIGEYAFVDCGSLAKVTIGTGVTDIGWEAFSGCTKLAEINYNAKAAADSRVTVDEGLTVHYADVFKDAGTSVGGVRVKIGDGVERIPAYLFNNCTGLTSVTIPNSVTSIGEGAFQGCDNIEKVHITDIAAWCGILFDGAYSNPLVYGKNLYVNDALVTNLTIPSGVTSIGTYAFYNCTSLTSVTIPDSVTSIGSGAFYNCTSLTSVTIPDGVTSIGSGAFSDCKGLTSVTIPDGVTSIGDYAFSGCTGLTGIEIPEGVTKIGLGAFSCCKNLVEIRYNAKAAEDIEYDPMLEDITCEDHVFFGAGTNTDGLIVTIGSGVEKIPQYLFYDCTSLTSVTIPNSVTRIGYDAFIGCTGLKEVHFIGTEEEWKAVSIGPNNDPLINAAITYVKEPISGTCGENLTWTLDSNGLLTISGTGAMTDYDTQYDAAGELITTAPWGDQVKSVSIRDSVTGIGANAFYGCKNLTSVTMGSSVASIGASAFEACTGLTGIVLPGSVTGIGTSAFSNCIGLTAIEIPEGVTVLGNSAFFGCDNLKEIRYNARAAADLTGLSGAFRSAGTSVGGVRVIFGESVEKIPGNLFSNCTSLTSVTIGSNVTGIGDNAFYDCKGLVEINYNARAAECTENSFDPGDGLKVVFGEGVEKIPDYIFQYCTGLTSIRIPESVTSIGYRAFVGCRNLTDVYYGGTERQWSAITIYDGNTELQQANRHCEGKETLVPPTAKTSYLTSTGKPYIKWDAVAGADSYSVYRSGSKDGTYTLLGTTTSLNYTDSTANAGYTYYYKIRAAAADGTRSDLSAAVAGTCHCARPVVTPDYLTSTGKPYLKWAAVAGASQYEVYRSGSKDGTYTLLGTTTATNYTDSMANAGYTYYYKVKAVSKVKTAANSYYSTAVAATCHCARPAVTPDYLASTGKPYIKWTAVAGASKYEVYRSGSKDGTYTLLGTTTATNYTDSKANAGYTYYYKVKAVSKVKTAANSYYSAAVAATCHCARPAVKITTTSAGKPRLTWDAVAGASQYEIYRATSQNGTYTKMYTTTALSYTNTSAKAGTTYYYKVKAVSKVKTAANSAYSTVVSIKAK